VANGIPASTPEDLQNKVAVSIFSPTTNPPCITTSQTHNLTDEKSLDKFQPISKDGQSSEIHCFIVSL